MGQVLLTPNESGSVVSLLEAAWAASKTRSFLGSKFWSLVGRKGKKKASVAIAHKILVISYHILKTRQPYYDLGADFLEKRKSFSKEQLMICCLGIRLHRDRQPKYCRPLITMFSDLNRNWLFVSSRAFYCSIPSM